MLSFNSKQASFMIIFMKTRGSLLGWDQTVAFGKASSVITPLAMSSVLISTTLIHSSLIFLVIYLVATTTQAWEFMRSFQKLRYLNLSNAGFAGTIPPYLSNLTSLQVLDLSNNSFYGRLPQSLGSLLSLEELLLQRNEFTGTITEAHFQNLTRLRILDISSTALEFNVSANWVPPFQLESIRMRACPVGPTFPAWLRTQTTMVLLDLSRAGIVHTLPEWFWGILSNMLYLDLSHNGIEGKLPSSFEFASGKYMTSALPRPLVLIDLSSNRFEGTIPNYIQNIQWLDLSNNSFSGPLPLKINETMPELYMIDFSNNNINGRIPSTLCELHNLTMLFLSMNSLSGNIPDCWDHNLGLTTLDISFNHLSGLLPSSIFLLPKLESLSFSKNNLSGHIPSSIMKCKGLFHLDLGHNRLTGNIPTSLGKSITGLVTLILRSNNFVGNIPPQLSRLRLLGVLDLSNNHLSGTIPKSFGNFSSMKSIIKYKSTMRGLSEGMFLFMKGLNLWYDTMLPSISVMDLSKNDLHGDIPEEIWNLRQLHGLNLSGNHLTGDISDKIGSMSQLESLDLSRNELSGVIPNTLSKLNFLSVLNLSHNHLSGMIPMGGQLNTFIDPSIYTDNDDLCGFPLSKKCIDSETKEQGLKDEVDIEINDTIWFYFGIMSGLVVGSWTVWVVFLLKKSWKIAYLLFVDQISDALYVAFVMKFAPIKRCICSSR
ncbi:hypothetical protein J5N97_026602 [Dioscorea zingiberensis]|uniref:Uncharacterized protein n=1 Tax=Dioscorea zingiberensis TaxID=325984 RepID=A0A9D5H6V2_9LILI|nr:hypothetical protein J5N97_026602 [Dioscorea zingiberensis]